ncbi:hypothetical protein Taro_023160 [Colocasia esculenta]|uniref:GDP-L-galactose phosphorylase 1 n=1 Tax=Colocasia esculenta TaxID=4460 RepID=A0A843VDM2_COLES|nr:hypothetical protein [Colocasia esculenta]
MAAVAEEDVAGTAFPSAASKVILLSPNIFSHLLLIFATSSCLVMGLAGAMLPLYVFSSKNQTDFGMGGEETQLSFFGTLLLGQVIPGKYGFLAQLNEGRHLKKRPTEFRVDKVLQPFDGSKFNFTKVGQEEVLFMFEEGDGGQNQYFESAPVETSQRPHGMVAINVSPIEYGHVVLIPRTLDCLPQRIDCESLLLALHMADEAASPYFRLGYNSLGAFATINHLHFQAYYLGMPLAVEKAQTRRIMALSNGVNVFQLLEYPVRGLVFEGLSTLEDLSIVVSDACIFLQENNIPYNILISDSGKRVFLFPQCYAEKQALGEVSQELLDTQVNPAVWEISGHMVLKRKKDYEEASEEDACRLLAEVSLSAERFQEVEEYILNAILGNTAGEAIDTAAPASEEQGDEEEDVRSKQHHGPMLGPEKQEFLVLQ